MAKSCCVMIRSLHGEQAQSIKGRPGVTWRSLLPAVGRAIGYTKLKFRQSLPRARRLLRTKQYPAAEEDFNRLLRLGVHTAPVYSNLGVVYLRSGKPDDAIRMLERAKDLPPRLPEFASILVWHTSTSGNTSKPPATLAKFFHSTPIICKRDICRGYAPS